MAATIVFFHTELNTLNLFSRQLQCGFRDLGYEIYVCDMTDSVKAIGNLYAYLQQHKVIAMIGFNSRFFGLKTESGISVWETIGIPCINILVDHPHWYHDILLGMPRNGIVLCIDQYHMAYVTTYYPEIAVCGFLPHGGTFPAEVRAGMDTSGAQDGAGKNIPLQEQEAVCGGKPIIEREIDVLYAGSIKTAEDFREPDFSVFSFPAKQICDNAIAQLKQDPSLVIEQALAEECEKQKVNLSPEGFREFYAYCSYIENVVSTYLREKMVGAIAKSGIELTIYGGGWDKLDWISLPNVKYMGMTDPETILKRIGDTKILLNSMPWFRAGAHERIFNGMLAGCVVASEGNSYLRDLLPKDGWIDIAVTEKDAAMEQACAKIKNLLGNAADLQAMAQSGYQFAAGAHTWKHRAVELQNDLLQYL